jgi:hypothetical protein
MEIRIIPVVAVTVSLAVVALAITAGKAKAASIYLDAPNATSSTTKFDAKEVADTLHVAMNKYGTDEDIIMQVLGEVLAFGNRRYNSWTGDDWGFATHPLKYWLENELSTSSYLTLKSKFKKYL